MNAKIGKVLRDYVAPMVRRPKGLQVAALCYRTTEAGKEVLLVTSRDTGRWIIPKGWPMRGRTDPEAALQEAWEEAGVKKARVADEPVGRYGYDKMLNNGLPLPVETLVYPVEVEALAKDFPECHQRKRQWVAPKKAACLVREPELQSLLNAM